MTIEYRTIDTITLMQAIELLDSYSWLLACNHTNHTLDYKKTLALTLKSLRNASKPPKPIC